MALRKVISGMQTGADQAGLVVARNFGIETGGTAPKGYRTETGPLPAFARDHGVGEYPSEDYIQRTLKNVRDSDATVLFGRTMSSGSLQTIKFCKSNGRPFIENPQPKELAKFIEDNRVEVLNVAGNRASHNPDVYSKTYQALKEAFIILASRKQLTLKVKK